MLHDINPKTLKNTHEIALSFKKKLGVDFNIESTTSRTEALQQADFCLISIEVGNRFELWEQDWKVPLQYGIKQVYGENGGPGGMFHAMRQVPVIIEICEDIENRKILLDNLSDEEDFNKDHPMLWKQFALAVGADKNSVETVEHEHFTKEMIDNFFRLSRSTYAEGLGALYAYERQVPEIADTKIKGLVDHYDVSSDEGLEYFVVHKDADVEHREQSAELMNKLSDEEKLLAKEAGLSTVKVLWGFLSGLCEKHNIQA